MGEHSDDITQELALLHTLSGADFSRQVEKIAQRYSASRLSGRTFWTLSGSATASY